MGAPSDDVGSADTLVTASDQDRRAKTDPAPAAPELAAGAAIGRYTVVERLGSGAMGVVYAATDPTLDRKIAIKLVHGEATGTSAGQQRLLREAQAMAKLQHPNVVTVFEVGTHGAHVFLAMEYVAGSTFGEWLRKPRTQREIVGAFAAAGAGLAAAHGAGIVHRDFKPANVLVALDGRVRVADFGLATAPEPREPAAPAGDLAMTATGALLGTPMYMAPEQHRGEVATAKADQFAFCVALYDALYGAPPFAGSTYREYAENVLAGRVLEPPRGAHVPVELRKLLLRGLDGAPAERYPDMGALLAELARDPVARRRRMLAIGGGALVLAAAAAIAVFARHGAGDPCAAADAPLDRLWNPYAELGMRVAFAASGARTQAVAFDHASAAIGERVGELRAARRDACVATAVRHEQSPDLLDRRMACIDDVTGQVSSVIGLLSEHPSADEVARAADAVRAARSVAPCADRQSMLAGEALPTSPAMIAAVAALRGQIDRAEALDDLGEVARAQASFAALIPQADQLGVGSLRLRARYGNANGLEELAKYSLAVNAFRANAELAATLHDDVIVAQSWIIVYMLVGFHFGKLDEAKALEPVAAAAVARAGSTPELTGKLEDARGLVELASDQAAAACDHMAIALRETTKALGEKNRKTTELMNNYATALEDAGRYDEARAMLEHELAIRTETVGAEHAGNSAIHHSLGVLLDEMGQKTQALAEFQQASAIDLANVGSDGPGAAMDSIEIGVELVGLGSAAQAVPYDEHALDIIERHPDDARTLLGTALDDLAIAYDQSGRAPDALRMFDRAANVTSEQYGSDSPEVTGILDAECEVVYKAGDHERAFAMMNRSLAIKQAKLGPDNPAVAFSFWELCVYSKQAGAHAAAIDDCTRGLAIIEKIAGSKPELELQLLASRGEALHAAHRDAEAIADFIQARDKYREAKLPGKVAGVQFHLAGALWARGAHADAIAEMTAAAPALEEPADAKQARDWLAHHH